MKPKWLQRLALVRNIFVMTAREGFLWRRFLRNYQEMEYRFPLDQSVPSVVPKTVPEIQVIYSEAELSHEIRVSMEAVMSPLRFGLCKLRWHRGDILFLATVQGQVAHMNWLTFGRERQRGAMRSSEKMAVSWDHFTVPVWRGHGLQAYVLTRQVEFLQRSATQVRELGLTVNVLNEPSHRGVRKAWFTRGDTYRVRRFGPFRLVTKVADQQSERTE